MCPQGIAPSASIGGLRTTIRLQNDGSDCPQPRPSKNAAPSWRIGDGQLDSKYQTLSSPIAAILHSAVVIKSRKSAGVIPCSAGTYPRRTDWVVRMGLAPSASIGGLRTVIRMQNDGSDSPQSPPPAILHPPVIVKSRKSAEVMPCSAGTYPRRTDGACSIRFHRRVEDRTVKKVQNIRPCRPQSRHMTKLSSSLEATSCAERMGLYRWGITPSANKRLIIPNFGIILRGLT